MIPEATLNQILDRVDIVEVVSAVLPLRRAGRNFKACCPFHQEKTPSFHVNPDKQIFHCFGCNAGGNAFSFLMKFEKRDFPEVVESLAERVGIEIPKDRTVDKAIEERQAALYKAQRLAQELYHQILMKREDASGARAYLKKRGLSEKTLVDFQLGFAPDGWDTLTLALKKQIGEGLMEKTGLVLPRKEGGGFYDRFRKRVIFPILDMKGQCIAFGGRVMDDSVPKYLNSPETEIYVKGRHLYGLAQARQSIRELDAAIVVEGYMDVIGCAQAGVTNVVASLGTALTPEQVRLVKRQTQNVFILYDADKAGEAATQRGLELFLEEGMEIKIVRLPEGHDPDSYIRDIGIEAFKKAMAGAMPLFDYRLALLKKKFGTATLDARVKIANDMVKMFSRVRNEILVAAWTKELATQLQLSERALEAETRKSKEGELRPKPAMAPPPPAPAKTERQMGLAEALIIGLLLDRPRLIEEARETLSVDDFESLGAKEIFDRSMMETGLTATHLMNHYADRPEVVRFLSVACAEADKYNSADEKDKAFQDCVGTIKRNRKGARAAHLTSQLSGLNDESRIKEIMAELDKINKGMKKTR